MEFRVHVFKRFAYLLFALFIMNGLANYFYWYQSFIHFDQIMHFAGGVIGSLFLIWLFYKKYLRLLSNKDFKKVILINTLLFLLAALLWECMEYSVQTIFGLGHILADPRDSLDDLFFGALGSLVGLTYFLNKVRNLGIIKKGNGN
jgi:hypothetical protein